MGGFFTLGEIKERPGVYKRYENIGTETAGVTEKVAAAVITGNWGPLNTPVTVGHTDDISAIFGGGNGASVLEQIFYDGPAEAVVVRAGTGGTKATVTLKDTTSGTALDTVTLTAKYPGNRSLSITVKTSLDDSSTKEATIYEGTKELETRSFAAVGTVTEKDAFADAFADSKYVDVTKLQTGDGGIANVAQAAFTAGTNPTVDTAAYSAALSAIEPEVFHYICADTDDTAVHSLLAAFVARIYQDGAYARAVISEPRTVSFDTRVAHARAFNDEKVIYLGNGWKANNGDSFNGYLAAARLCGMLAACPSNQSLTHATVKGAASLYDGLTNSQIKKALKNGCLVLALNNNRQVVIEKAINTLVTPATNQDAGWKKIKRTDIRFELMDRIEKAVDGMIGKVNNDTNGRAAVIAAAQRVIDAMVGEGKIISGNALQDSTNPPAGDSAWFTVTIDDIDALETIYLTFRYRFSQNS